MTPLERSFLGHQRMFWIFLQEMQLITKTNAHLFLKFFIPTMLLEFISVLTGALLAEPSRKFIKIPSSNILRPVLASVYKKLTAEGKKFEILFASSDRSQKDFDEYFHEMPWKAIPYPDRERKEKLSRFFGVEGIPTFIMLDPSGKIINDNARGEVSEDPEGKNFPWPAPEPVPLNQLNSPLVEKINENPTFVMLLDKTEDAKVQSYVDLVTPIATEVFNKNKALDEDDDTPRMLFFYGTKDHEMAENLRGFFNPRSASEPVILISDIPRQKKYVFQEKEVNASTVKSFVEGYFSKTLQGVGIKS